MISLALAAAAAAAIGALVAVAARDRRIVAIGLLVAMVSAPLASSPEPQPLAIALRILGAVLAAYLLWAAASARSTGSEGSGIGIAAEIAVAAAAFVVGWFVTPVAPLPGPVAAQAAGMAFVALAITPLTGRNVMRAGIGLTVLVLGISLLLQAWVGPASTLGQIVLVALLIGTVGATSLLLSPSEPPASGRQAADEAIDPAWSLDTDVEAAESDTAGESAPDAETAPGDAQATVQAAVQAVVRQPPRLRSATIRGPGAKSPRAIRHNGPTRKPEGAAPVEGATDQPASPPAIPQASPRARRLRPREPRQ